jgi:hypothetical protein
MCVNDDMKPLRLPRDSRSRLDADFHDLQLIKNTDFSGWKLCKLSSGQSSWLQIRRPGFDSRHYQKIKVVGLERGPLSLVSTTEELLDRKVAAPV